MTDLQIYFSAVYVPNIVANVSMFGAFLIWLVTIIRRNGVADPMAWFVLGSVLVSLGVIGEQVLFGGSRVSGTYAEVASRLDILVIFKLAYLVGTTLQVSSFLKVFTGSWYARGQLVAYAFAYILAVVLYSRI